MTVWAAIIAFFVAYALLRMAHHAVRARALNKRDRSPQLVAAEIEQVRLELNTISEEYASTLRELGRASYGPALERSIAKAGDRINPKDAEDLRAGAEVFDGSTIEHEAQAFPKWAHRLRPIPLSQIEFPSDMTSVQKQAGSAVAAKLAPPGPVAVREGAGFLRRLAAKGTASVSEAAFRESVRAAATATADTSADPSPSIPVGAVQQTGLERALDDLRDSYVARFLVLRDLHYELHQMGLPDNKRRELLDYPTNATAV